MSSLRTIRILLATLFFVASVAFLCIGPGVHPMARMAETAQVVPSAIAVCIGATAFWLAISFLFGRIYCATVCPIGTLQDLGLRARRATASVRHRQQPRFRYRQRRRWRTDIMIGYIICLLLGFVGVPWLLEPWNMMRNISSAVNPSAVSQTWATLGYGAAVGVTAGIASLLLMLLWGALAGRRFCTDICPLGTLMGALDSRTLMHIEIDPDKCSGCLKCEEICRAQCIKVTGRHVDNSRCVRCFDCLHICPDDAIHFQPDRNRPATPLLRKKKTISR